MPHDGFPYADESAPGNFASKQPAAPDEGDPIFDAAFSYLSPHFPQLLARELAVRIATLARENMKRIEAARG